MCRLCVMMINDIKQYVERGRNIMWTRRELKERGKAALHRNYWIVVLVSLLTSLLTGEIINSGGNGGRIGRNVVDVSNYIPMVMIVSIITAILGAGLLYSIFAGNVFEVGGCRFFEENSEHKARTGLILDGFKNGAYWRNVSTIFLRNLYSFLWTLCLIIPGIVKSFEYKMISFILAENPEISRKRAFELSKQMMDGQKWEAFVLDLSFIGWNLLSAITFGIVGVLYVNPYVNTTWAEFYKVMRENALATGIATVEELPGLRQEADI